MKKKTIFIIVLSVLIIFTSLFIFFSNKQPKVTTPLIVSSEPKNGAIEVNEKSEIIITLNRNLSEEDSKKLNVAISPETPIRKVYQENKIRINPETSFNFKTEYSVTIDYENNNIYTLKFNTPDFTQQEIDEQGLKQSRADYDFNEAYKKFLNDFPWYTSLPIEKNLYRIIYDFDSSSFRIRFKTPNQSEEIKKQIIDSALADLKKIGVPEPIKYYTLESTETPKP